MADLNKLKRKLSLVYYLSINACMKFTKLSTVALTICTILSQIKIAEAQSSNNYYAGQSSGGQSINVDLNSISRASSKSVDFVYYLGEERIQSQANCEAGTWTTFPERAINRPQSQATQNMLNVVCQNRASNSSSRRRVARVFDPPSNVRTSPNGSALCSVRNITDINIYSSTGDWYYTDVCGEMGVIHSSQIRF